MNCKKKIFKSKKKSPAGGHFDYRWKAENLIRSSPYSWVTSHKKMERCHNYFQSYRVNKTVFFWIFYLDLWPMTLTFGKKTFAGGFECLYKLWIQSVGPCWRSTKIHDRTDSRTPDGRTTREHNAFVRFAAEAKKTPAEMKIQQEMCYRLK